MARVLAAQAVLSFLASTVAAQDGAVQLCTGDDCGWCPNSMTTTGTGYPSCVIYDTATILGGYAGDYEDAGGSFYKQIWYDVPENSNPECKTIIRTPASPTDPNCGVPIYGASGGVCYGNQATKDTVMVQFCCGTGDCGAAGAKRSDGSAGMMSAVFKDHEGNLIQPLAVGHGLEDGMDLFLADHGINASSVVATVNSAGIPIYKRAVEEPVVNKRDCDNYTPDGEPYTKTGGESFQISGYICGPGSEVTYTNENSVSRTTTFGASVGDPFGIVQASIEFSTEESASQSASYTFKLEDNICGHLSWTPFFDCTGGTITGCEGGDQTGEVCTARRIGTGDSDDIDGAYSFVQTD